MSSLLNKVKGAVRGDENDGRYGNSTHRPYDNHHGLSHHPHDDQGYGTDTVTTTGTTTQVTRTPADEYDSVDTTSSNRFGTGQTVTSPSATEHPTSNFGRSEPPPLPGREAPAVPDRRPASSYLPSTAAAHNPANNGTTGERIGEALTGDHSGSRTGTYNTTPDNRGLVDRTGTAHGTDSTTGSNSLFSHNRTNTNTLDNSNKHGSIHDLRKDHESRNEQGRNNTLSGRNDTTSIFGTNGTSGSHQSIDDYNQRNTAGNDTFGQHGAGLTSKEQESRDANIAGSTGALGLANSSSVQRRAVGNGNANRNSNSHLNSGDTLRDDPAVSTVLGSATTGTNIPQRELYNSVGSNNGTSSNNPYNRSGQDGIGRSVANAKYDSNIPSIVPAVGPAPKAANDRRFDDDRRSGDNDNNNFSNQSRHDTASGIPKSTFNERQGYGDSRDGRDYNRQNDSTFRDNDNRRYFNDSSQRGRARKTAIACMLSAMI
ncbi:uncharacterized protein AB675_10416 [Cyphellophora attinorum]|uniref:Uncharacterized protein n=1 Tax=Cyphellophora attinorum TaxID=1664694 RepID=A0A0N1GYQ8_9EURO|nr:uncharacterized protein AB675_10416 [Phialophora attinorum]KPI35993.1 hypothetical protein AB675_10416 [Phialophora attinorum]